MQELGAKMIVVNEKQSDGNYKAVYTFTPEKYANLIGKNWQMQVAYHQYENNAYGNDPYKMTLSTLARSVAWK